MKPNAERCNENNVAVEFFFLCSVQLKKGEKTRKNFMLGAYLASWRSSSLHFGRKIWTRYPSVKHFERTLEIS